MQFHIPGIRPTWRPYRCSVLGMSKVKVLVNRGPQSHAEVNAVL